MGPEQERQDRGLPPAQPKPMLGNEFGARLPIASPQEPSQFAPEQPAVAPMPLQQPIVGQTPTLSPANSVQAPVEARAQEFTPSVVSPQQQPVQPVAPVSPQPAPQPSTGKNKKLITFVVVALVTLVLIGIGLFAFIWWKNNQIALNTYNGPDYSVLVPSEYKIDESESTDTSKMFIEQDATASTRSYVGAGVEAYADGERLSDAQFEQFKKAFGKSFVDDSLKEKDTNGVSVNNAQISVKEQNGSITYSGVGDMQKDDAAIGRATFMFRFTKTGAEFVVVAANQSDPALQKNAQKIVDSFTVK